MSTVNQRNATRNQSTADFQSTIPVFIFNNRFTYGIFKNTSGAELTLKRGMLVARSLTVVNGLIPVDDTNLADVVGIAAVEEDVVLANNASVNINMCVKGTVDGTALVLPAAVTLDTVEGNKTLRDVLEAVGFHIDTTSVEHTKFDN
ncbi:MAG: hypothetical protein V4547_16330 [Bacteroidota bacterium]